MDRNLSFHSSVEGHLKSFQFGAIMNIAALNILTQVFVWTDVFVELLSRMGNVWLTNCQAVFKNGSTILHFPSNVLEFQLFCSLVNV